VSKFLKGRARSQRPPQALLDVTMPGHWLYRFFPEVWREACRQSWGVQGLYAALQEMDFAVQLRRQTVYNHVPGPPNGVTSTLTRTLHRVTARPVAPIPGFNREMTCESILCQPSKRPPPRSGTGSTSVSTR